MRRSVDVVVVVAAVLATADCLVMEASVTSVADAFEEDSSEAALM